MTMATSREIQVRETDEIRRTEPSIGEFRQFVREKRECLIKFLVRKFEGWFVMRKWNGVWAARKGKVNI